jgi:hypothetical protein
MSFTFEYKGIEVEAEVDSCRDAYGTGDSPTLYDVDLIRAWDIEEDREIELDDLSSQFYDELIDEAIQEYKG